MAYVTFDEMQHLLIEHIQLGGKPLDYPEACALALEQGIVHSETPQWPEHVVRSIPSRMEFLQYLHRMPLSIYGAPPVWPYQTIQEEGIRAFQHLYNPESEDHIFPRFVLYYAFQGPFRLQFERKRYDMQIGDVVIVAPGCRVIAYMPPESIVLGLNVDPKVFESVFYSAINNGNLVSRFLHSVLYSSDHVNFLIFHTGKDEAVQLFFQMIMMQNTSYDSFTQSTKEHILGMMLTHLVRYWSTHVTEYHSSQQASFSAIIAYIQSNWQQVTLRELAERFHYNTAYLSRLISSKTGKTFSMLIQELRMEEACHRLVNTDQKVTAIAYATGFHSTEHFSRSFRKIIGMSPEAYRRNHRMQNASC